MAAENDGVTILLIAGVVVGYFWLTKPKGPMLRQNAGQNPGTASAGGCGCPGGAVPVGARNQTTPVNPAVSLGRGQTLTAPMNQGSPGDYAGPSAPGSNLLGSGSGGNWLGVATDSMTALTPNPAPANPYAPSGVWHANSTPTLVRGS